MKTMSTPGRFIIEDFDNREDLCRAVNLRLEEGYALHGPVMRESGGWIQAMVRTSAVMDRMGSAEPDKPEGAGEPLRVRLGGADRIRLKRELLGRLRYGVKYHTSSIMCRMIPMTESSMDDYTLKHELLTEMCLEDSWLARTELPSGRCEYTMTEAGRQVSLIGRPTAEEVKPKFCGVPAWDDPGWYGTAPPPGVVKLEELRRLYEALPEGARAAFRHIVTDLTAVSAPVKPAGEDRPDTGTRLAHEIDSSQSQSTAADSAKIRYTDLIPPHPDEKEYLDRCGWDPLALHKAVWDRWENCWLQVDEVLHCWMDLADAFPRRPEGYAVLTFNKFKEMLRRLTDEPGALFDHKISHGEFFAAKEKPTPAVPLPDPRVDTAARLGTVLWENRFLRRLHLAHGSQWVTIGELEELREGGEGPVFHQALEDMFARGALDTLKIGDAVHYRFANPRPGPSAAAEDKPAARPVNEVTEIEARIAALKALRDSCEAGDPRWTAEKAAELDGLIKRLDDICPF